MTLGPPEALVLDFDGLILDTEMAEFRSLAELYSRHGAQLTFAEWQATVGTVGHDWVTRLVELGAQIEIRESQRLLLERQRELVAAEPFLPGVSALLEEAHAKQIPVGLASSGTRDRILPELERRGALGRLATVVTREDVSRPKPDPEPYLRAAGALGARPEATVAFEDSAPGVAAAIAAGLRCVAVPSEVTADQDFTEATLVIQRLDALDLPALGQGRLESLVSRPVGPDQ